MTDNYQDQIHRCEMIISGHEAAMRRLEDDVHYARQLTGGIKKRISKDTLVDDGDKKEASRKIAKYAKQAQTVSHLTRKAAVPARVPKAAAYTAKKVKRQASSSLRNRLSVSSQSLERDRIYVKKRNYAAPRTASGSRGSSVESLRWR